MMPILWGVRVREIFGTGPVSSVSILISRYVVDIPSHTTLAVYPEMGPDREP